MLRTGDFMNPDNCTIIYYTSNRENEEFEKKIRYILFRMAGGIPIISVSQKPINFGKNVCVGDVGANDHNLYRQVQIACQEAETPFVISAEADNLYHKDYFDFDAPDINTVYRYNNVWLLKRHHKMFARKAWCEGAQIIGREYYLKLLDIELYGKPLWMDGHNPTNPFRSMRRNWTYYGTEFPVVSIKTGNGLRANTRTIPEEKEFLPYWGSTRVVRRKLGIR
jgi:hypothetical protein